MKFILSITLTFLTIGVYAQNTFPASGSVGIGTNSPQQALDVRGNAIVNGRIVTSATRDIGGALEIHNPAKTAGGIASTWTIYNMTGGYSNSLQFWAYDNLGCVSGGMCANRFTIMDNGNVGVGTTTPSDKLSVNGKIRAQEIKVELTNWPDFVFSKNYMLPTLAETEKHIKEKGHLPGIPSAEEVEKNGIELGDMNKKLLQKIEELTLYLIEKDKKEKEQQQEIDVIKDQLNKILAKQN